MVNAPIEKDFTHIYILFHKERDIEMLQLARGTSSHSTGSFPSPPDIAGGLKATPPPGTVGREFTGTVLLTPLGAVIVVIGPNPEEAIVAGRLPGRIPGRAPGSMEFSLFMGTIPGIGLWISLKTQWRNDYFFSIHKRLGKNIGHRLALKLDENKNVVTYDRKFHNLVGFFLWTFLDMEFKL